MKPCQTWFPSKFCLFAKSDCELPCGLETNALNVSQTLKNGRIFCNWSKEKSFLSEKLSLFKNLICFSDIFVMEIFNFVASRQWCILQHLFSWWSNFHLTENLLSKNGKFSVERNSADCLFQMFLFVSNASHPFFQCGAWGRWALNSHMSTIKIYTVSLKIFFHEKGMLHSDFMKFWNGEVFIVIVCAFFDTQNSHF